MLLLVARGGAPALSHGCRGVAPRSSHSTPCHAVSTTRRNHRPDGCRALCGRAATALRPCRVHVGDRGRSPCFGNGAGAGGVLGRGPAAAARTPWRALHASGVKADAPAAPAPGDILRPLGAAAPAGDAASAWTLRELAGAVLFAGAASAAGSLLLGGSIEGLRGQGRGGGSGGGGDPGGPGGGGPPVDDARGHSFEPRAGEAEEREGEAELGLETAAVPKPYEVSVRALRGGRLSMEDEFVVACRGRLAAVFDGHGGGGVSQYLRDRLHVIIAEQLHVQERARANSNFHRGLKGLVFGKGPPRDATAAAAADAAASPPPPARLDPVHAGRLSLPAVAAALRDSFAQADREILKSDELEYQGSTAVAALLHETGAGARTLLSANVGDSRGVLSRRGRAVDLTRDHKPNDEGERERILAMGEKIEWDHYCKVHRVRNLSLSRAMGDRFAKPAVSGEVEIKQFPVKDDEDEFLLLASDGLWDVMTSQEAVSYVHKRLQAPPKDGADITCEADLASLTYLRRKNMSRFVANEALRRGSGDNISVVIVWLAEVDPHRKRR